MMKKRIVFFIQKRLPRAAKECAER